MGKLVVTEFISLDGVIEDPGGAEELRARRLDVHVRQRRGGRRVQVRGAEAADAQLLGRVTYEGFAKAWPTMEGTGEFGEKMNSMPKFVVSKTLASADWENSTIVSGELADEVAALKERYETCSSPAVRGSSRACSRPVSSTSCG